jgi:hypothetical protein
MTPPKAEAPMQQSYYDLVAEEVADSRDRQLAIIMLAEARGREALALYIIENTSMTVAEAEAALATSPRDIHRILRAASDLEFAFAQLPLINRLRDNGVRH